MPQKHFTIPLFIPQLACPFQCVYCNQRNISGQKISITESEIVEVINKYLSTIPTENSEIEAGFFGGNFTGLSIEEQEKYLKIVQPYPESGAIHGIRLSTRPDYIDVEILALLKRYHVKTIELGAQSLDEEVLRLSGRGHTAQEIVNASSLIKKWGFDLGLQMMCGLPADTLEKSLQTARTIVSLGADNTRIYPALVIKDTELENLFQEKKYIPLSLEEAVEWTKEIYKVFEEAGVKVIRMGLHPSEGLLDGGSLVAGPFHVSFGELVMTALWKEAFMPLLKDKQNEMVISVPAEQINNAIGHRAANKKMLEQHYKKVRFITDPLLKGRNFHADHC
jgi:histone acetyltransferase (RNA polymerase elongator complex component)